MTRTQPVSNVPITIHPAKPPQEGLFGADGFSVGDVVDAINPLHHIPFVSSLYASATGDKASAASKLVGGALLGGPVGFLVSLFDVAFESETGKSVEGSVLAALSEEDLPANATQPKERATPTAFAAQAVPVSPLEDFVPTRGVEAPSSAPALPDPAAARMALQATDDAQTQMRRAIAEASSGAGEVSDDAMLLALFARPDATTHTAHQAYRTRAMVPNLPPPRADRVM